MTSASPLRRNLGLPAVFALVVGNIIGSGIFFTPGELAAVAQHPWQVHFIWALSGIITLCGALTLAELCALLPEAGATYHILRDGFGPFWGFLQVWFQLWVTGPASIAGLGIAFGDFMHRLLPGAAGVSPVAWGAAVIALAASVNLAGVQWGGRTQILLTVVKLTGIAALIVGGLLLAPPATQAVAAAELSTGASNLLAFIRFSGLGIAAVLFTYDGWIDVSNVAGEVRNPKRDFPLALGLGVAAVTAIYLMVNFAFLRVVPLLAMRDAPSTVAATVATAAYGIRGGTWLNALLVLSILGSLGGLVMTLPRLFYTLASMYAGPGRGVDRFFAMLSRVSPRTAVPSGSIIFTAVASIVALIFFGSLSRLVNFLLVPMQVSNILMVAALFRLRRRNGVPAGYRTLGYPVTPVVYILVMSGFLVSAIIYQPTDTLIGVAIAATGFPVYRWLSRR